MQDIHIPESEIEQQFRSFMTANNCEAVKQIPILMDGKIHRYKTVDDKGSQTSGAYCLYADGWPNGWVQNWRDGKSIKWSFNKDDSSVKSSLTEEKIKALQSKSQQHQKELQEQQKALQAEASERARILYESSPFYDLEDYPYLAKKHVLSVSLHIDESTNNLLVPLRDIDGNFKSIQFISPDGNKKFYPGAPTAGAFFGFWLDKMDEHKNWPILLGEGYATMYTAQFLTNFPAVAAMSCNNLMAVTKALLAKYPDRKIVILPDDDRKTPGNPGRTEANKVFDELKKTNRVFMVSPPFQPDDEGSDWNDFYALQNYNEGVTREIIRSRIREVLMTPEEKAEKEAREKLAGLMRYLDPSVQIAPQEFIGGMFPRRFVSALVAQSGIGKTMFLQKFCSDLSIGGSIFDGFTEDEPQRMCLIFTGEAGYELMIRRGAQTKWAVNPQRVHIVDQYSFERADTSVMLDDSVGWVNIQRIVDMTKPDIIFFDSLVSFHERDENKAAEMKPIIKRLDELARKTNCAIVLVHHSRKRTAKERSLSLNQDDVIGSSVFNRLVGLIIGIEPMKEDEKTLLVRTLKTWFAAFMPFTYRITENLDGRTVMETDLAPANVNNSKIAVWNYLVSTFAPGEWFSFTQIILSEINPNVTEWQLRRIITGFVNAGKLNRRGATKSLEYSLIGHTEGE